MAVTPSLSIWWIRRKDKWFLRHQIHKMLTKSCWLFHKLEMNRHWRARPCKITVLIVQLSSQIVWHNKGAPITWFLMEAARYKSRSTTLSRWIKCWRTKIHLKIMLQLNSCNKNAFTCHRTIVLKNQQSSRYPKLHLQLSKTQKANHRSNTLWRWRICNL